MMLLCMEDSALRFTALGFEYVQAELHGFISLSMTSSFRAVVSALMVAILRRFS